MQLTNLTQLFLSNNYLVGVPSELIQLTKLEVLDLGSNRLAAFPLELCQLTGLTRLGLYANNMTFLPPETCQLAKLTEFRLNNNKLTTLPPEVGQLTNLTVFDLTGNQLAEILPEVALLTNLTALGLGDNQLTILPPEIGQLAKLTEFHLNNNTLTTLPPEVGQLTNLIALDLTGNQLTEFLPEVGQLTNLTRLGLADNQLVTLPSEIGQLSKLIELRLNNNKLTALPPEVGQLTNLTVLDLTGNQLTALPTEIGHLARLEALGLGGNNLGTLPPTIGRLARLTELHLENNKLIELPSEVDRLIKLKHLSLGGNPISIPVEISEKTTEPANIINYYLQHRSGQSKPLNEAKMLLVGQASVGKTSLLKRLVMGHFNPYENKTTGINIQPWHINVNDREIRLNVWDFGGQEIYHATHQFFLTKRSLYLLVLDARLGEEENRLDYWLKMIQSFGGDSPIIIVGNKIDQQPLDLNRHGLQEKYKTIKAFIETSCQTGQGIDELKTHIASEIGQLAHIHDEMLTTWGAVKTRLEQMDEDYIPFREYVRLCKLENVTDELSQKTLIGFLHDLGVVLNFQDDPRLEDTSILRPEWVTKGVYRILNSNALFQSKGVLTRQMLNQILESPEYPRDKHLFIIDVMRKFELCFDFEGFVDQKFLIPDLLGKEEPFTGEWDETLAFQYHYNILPGSIISRFIVRMHTHIYQQTYWRSGVVLAYEGNKALVKADREEKKVFIWISGTENTRRAFLAIIRSQFDAIHKTIAKIEAEEKVPLPSHPEIVVDYENLRIHEELGEKNIIISELKQRVSVKELLDGVDDPERKRISRQVSGKDDDQNLLDQYNRRLQKLKEQQAKLGISTPPEILNEIEDLKAEIEGLESQLRII